MAIPDAPVRMVLGRADLLVWVAWRSRNGFAGARRTVAEIGQIVSASALR